MKYSKTQDSVYCAPCRFFGPYVNCIRFQIKLNPLHIWENKISKSTTYLYYIALLNILFLKIYVQKLTCCSWKLGFRGIILSARKLQECRILHHLPPAIRPPLRGWGGWPEMLDTSAPVWDISAPRQFGTCVFFFDFAYKTSNSLEPIPNFNHVCTSPLKGVNPMGTLGYRNGTESFFGLKGRLSVVRDV
jgi:hypothetical protein